MRDLSKNFYKKMQDRFDAILHENDQVLFVAKKGGTDPIDMDYSRVLFNYLFEIHKKSPEDRSVIKVESDDFHVINSKGENPVTFHVIKDGAKAELTKEQYEKVLIDSCGNLYKIDPGTKRAVPADLSAGFTVELL